MEKKHEAAGSEEREGEMKFKMLGLNGKTVDLQGSSFFPEERKVDAMVGRTSGGGLGLGHFLLSCFSHTTLYYGRPFHGQ